MTLEELKKFKHELTKPRTGQIVGTGKSPCQVKLELAYAKLSAIRRLTALYGNPEDMVNDIQEILDL